MNCEVVVVGGGIGGLTVAALLAQRGVDVCLFERQSNVGGCAANFEKFGYSFDQTYGLFSGWNSGEIYERVFAELSVKPPEHERLNPGYVVRLPDSVEVPILAADQDDDFFAILRQAFPECADQAVAFYRQIAPLAKAWRSASKTTPGLQSASKASRVFSLLREGRIGNEIIKAAQQSTARHLSDVSHRFRSFVDLQLQTFTQSVSSDVSYLAAAIALTAPREGLYGLSGGSAAVVETLSESIKQSGGRLRLDSPVLRLSYDSSGAAVGVDLLSGEVVTASRAIVSNLTVWDTYGKLVGLNRTPPEIRKQLNTLRSWGAYQMYLGFDAELLAPQEDAGGTPAIPSASTLSSDHVLALTEWSEGQAYAPEAQLFFTTASGPDRAPAGKRAVTVHAFTDVDEWFTYHQDETELEAQDQQTLERYWQRLHTAMPELGSSVEVIETATPRSFYELTRRKLGMMGGLPPDGDFWLAQPGYVTSLPNLFLVGDTAASFGLEHLVLSTWLLANKIGSN